MNKPGSVLGRAAKGGVTMRQAIVTVLCSIVLASCQQTNIPVGMWSYYEGYKAEAHYRVLVAAPGPPGKAWAFGSAWGYRSVETAIERAKGRCERYKTTYNVPTKCRLWMVGEINVSNLRQEEIDAAIALYKSNVHATLDDLKK